LNSSSAKLTVISPPAITKQPIDLTINEGRNATFSVSAAGTTPLSYQWYNGERLIPGANSNRLALQKVTLSENGSTYKVVVTNSGGSITSNAVVLTVQ
jgi:hypothetical protein